MRRVLVIRRTKLSPEGSWIHASVGSRTLFLLGVVFIRLIVRMHSFLLLALVVERIFP